MSDHFILLIPRDPHQIPTHEKVDAALGCMRVLAPEADSITFTIHDSVQFCDCGGNMESVACPDCQAILDQDWWSAQMDDDYDGNGFRLLPLCLPCCGKAATLNELVYVLEQGFSRFVLEAMNPNIDELSEEVASKIETLLGLELKVIYRHL